MSMDPDHFRELLDRAVEQAPPAPTSDNLAAGRARLRRRHSTLGLTAAIVGTITVVGLTTLAGNRPGAESFEAPMSSLSDQDLIEQCRAGNQDAVATQALFGPGEPTVEGVSRNAHEIDLALQSTDRAYWASCFIHSGAAEFHSGMTVFHSSGGPANPVAMLSGGSGCESTTHTESCTTFVASFVDRLPPAVATVEFTTGDGLTSRVPSHEGYVVFNHLGDLPTGETWRTVDTFETIRYLNRQGETIASQGVPGSKAPALSAYRSLRGKEVQLAPSFNGPPPPFPDGRIHR